MFQSRRSHPDIKKTTQKFLDPKKETQGRLRALRVLLETFGTSDSKVFFQGHYSEIYYVFYDVFCMVENNLKQKGHRSQREDLDGVLYILEKILLLLPELVHKRWQFHSIGRIMQKLLHHGNALKDVTAEVRKELGNPGCYNFCANIYRDQLRREGVRLFMLWYQCLQVNSDEFSQLMYASIIPGFPNAVESIDWTKSVLSRVEAEEVVHTIRGPENEDHSCHSSMSSFHVADKDTDDWCSQEEVQPVYPIATNEKFPSPETLTKFFLDRVLDCMSSQMVLVEWSDNRARDQAFSFLFNSFKQFYLPFIFPHWNPAPALYDIFPVLQVPIPTMKSEDMCRSARMVGARESVLRWFVAFTVRFKRQEGIAEPGSPSYTSTSMESLPPASPTTPSGMGTSPVDVLKNINNDKKKEDLHAASDIIRKVLYSTKENVQLLHEVLRQGFRLPPRNLNTIRQVLSVYQEWIKHSEKPIFMQEPGHSFAHLTDTVDSPRDLHVVSDEPQSPVRTWSYIRAVNVDGDRAFTLPSEEVRAGLQANLRLFILHSAEVFLVPEDLKDLDKQVDICKRVIHLYRSIVLEVPMEARTWEQLLLVLLEACRHLLSRDVPGDRSKSLSGQLACNLLQTVFVTWIRANLKVQVSLSLWDKCLDVVSSLTHWEEVITEWSTTLETLTRVLARTVYSLDLEDLPLDRLSEQKRKRRRHLLQEKPNFDKLAFSRWSRMDGRSTGSPKIIRTTLDKGDGMASAPVTPSVHRPSAQHVTGNQPQMIGGTAKELRVLSTERSAFKSTESMPKLADPPKKTGFIESSNVTAGTVTNKGSETAGQLSSPKDVSNGRDGSHNMDSKPNSPQMNRAAFIQTSDTDSIESGELQIQPRVDMESDFAVNGLKEDKTDFGSTPPLLKRSLENSSNTLGRQDTLKSMEWFNMSFENEGGSLTPIINNESSQGLTRISESSLESKFDDVMRNSVETTDRTSTPVYDQEIPGHNGLIVKDAADDMADNTGIRFSTVLTGRESPDDLAPSYRSPSPSLAEIHEELLDMDESERGPHQEDTSVLAGGTREGWGPVASVVLWKRMLGILGNVNKIKNPSIHARVIECLITISDMLAKVRMNQGISIDNKFTPVVPELLPPLQYYATWVFEAASLSMPFKFKSGRLLAYQLMCAVTVRRHDMSLSHEYLTHFYRLMHIGLTGTDQDVISVIISNCSHFFSLMLPCSTLLILDFIQAANTIFINQNLELPRAEAVTLMGSLLCYPNAFPNMPLHQPGHQTNEYQPTSTSKDIKEKLIVALLRAAKLDPSASARCIALNSLSVFVVEELIHCQGHPRVADCICVLLQCVTFNHRSICSMAIDLLHLLSQYYTELCAFDYDLPLKIVDVMCHTTVSLLPGGECASVQEENLILVSVIICLLDWVMVIPTSRLLANKGDDNRSVLSRVFQVLQMAANNKVPQKRRKSLNISTIISGDGRPIRLARVQDTNKPVTLAPSPYEPAESAEDVLETGRTIPVSFAFPPKPEPVKLTAKAALTHLVNHLGHFPLCAGPSRLDSHICEHEDNASVEVDELQPTIFNSPNIQFFILNDSVIVTIVELPKEKLSKRFVLEDMTTAKTQVRLIMRDMTGRYSWDYTMLYGRNSEDGKRLSFPGLLQGLSVELEIDSQRDSTDFSSRRNLRGELQTIKTPTPITPDRLDDALSYIGTSSRECVLFPDQALNEPAPSSDVVERDMEMCVMESVLNQNTAEEDYIKDNMTDISLSSVEFRPPSHVEPSSPFQLCRFLISENGIMAWEKRLRVDLLNKNEKFLRELKNLDNRRCRETHKIAVLYVARGQEDKTSIMSNSAGSQAYENFVAGLGYEVDLSKHTGFMGGLERNLSTGATAPYFATSTLEVMFHVSTRMPLATDGTGFNKKMRHLGNDEVHIVWSEHTRDYRYGIVNTEFGDVLIVIYPLKNNLFRIHVITKPGVPSFGPLFDGAIVNRRVLPSLVRATAINAGKAKRSLLPLYERYYEERDKCIERIVHSHKQLATFEEFTSRIFCPAPNAGSRPSTPAMSTEQSSIYRTQTAPSSLVTDQDSSLRYLSKSTGTGLLGNGNEPVDEELLALAISLPDELNKVSSQGEGGAARQDKRRLSLRWRNKPSPTALVEAPAEPAATTDGINGEE